MTKNNLMFRKLFFLPLLILLIGCALQPVTDPRQPSPDNEPTAVPTAATIEKPTYTVETGSVVSEKILSGRVVPQQQTPLEFKTSGRVTEVLVKRDDVVAEGDMLIRLDTEDLEQALAFAETNLGLAQGQLEEVQNAIANQLFLAEIDRDIIQLRLDFAIEQAGSDSANSNLTSINVQIAQAQRFVNDAQEAFDKAHDPGRDWELEDPWRADFLIEERRATERGLIEAREYLSVAYAQYNISVAGIDVVSAEEKLQIDLLTLDLKRAQFAVDQLTNSVDPALEAQIAQAQLEVDQLRAEIEKSTLIASTSGTILSITPKVGDVVIENETVAIIADLSSVEVNAITPGCDLAELAEGMSVTLLRNNQIGDPVLLTIYEMPAPFGSAEQPADGSCPVRISFDNEAESAEFEAGDRVTMNAQLDERQEVLWLPPAAVREFNGRSFVVIQDGATQKRIDITIGLQNNQRIEIESGLEEGQVVIGP